MTKNTKKVIELLRKTPAPAHRNDFAFFCYQIGGVVSVLLVARQITEAEAVEFGSWLVEQQHTDWAIERIWG